MKDGGRKDEESATDVDGAVASAVVIVVDAVVILFFGDGNPVCLVNATNLLTLWTGICRCYLDPSAAFLGDAAQLACHFREVVILTEKNGDIECVFSRHADEIEGNLDIDPLLAGDDDPIFMSVPQRPRHDCDARVSRGEGKLFCPEVVPEGVLGEIVNAGVNPDPFKMSVGMALLKQEGELDGIEVGIGVAPGQLGRIEQVLTVEEGVEALDRWFPAMRACRQKNNPLRISRRGRSSTSSGGINHSQLHAYCSIASR